MSYFGKKYPGQPLWACISDVLTDPAIDWHVYAARMCTHPEHNKKGFYDVECPWCKNIEPGVELVKMALREILAADEQQ